MASGQLSESQPEVYTRLLELTEAMRFVLPEAAGLGVLDLHPLLGRVLGIQVAQVEKTLIPTVFVEVRAPVLRIVGPNKEETGPEDQEVDAILGEVRGWIQKRTDVVGFGVGALPAPLENVAPADPAYCGTGPGTFGSKVYTNSGAKGITTAGHVAPMVGSIAFSSNLERVGTVNACAHCRTVGPGVDTPDIAIVEMDPTAVETTGAPAPSGVSAATIWDTVTAYGAVTSASSRLLSVGAPFAGPTPAAGNWGEAMLTAYPISAGGDSGAAVHNRSGALVGHIVGGYPGIYSIIQDAAYQFQAFGAKLR